jgi:alanine dehydrogenase
LRTIDPATVNELLDTPSLVAALHAAFRDGGVTPVRHHHSIPMGARDGATLLLIPAWDTEVPPRHIGVKTVTVHPEKPTRSPAEPHPSIQGVYLLLDGQTGAPQALIDGPALTARRTAAASALASRFLSRMDSQRLVMVGTGRVAPELIIAHCAERPISHVAVWGRDADKAEKLARRMSGQGFGIEACGDLEAAIANADITAGDIVQPLEAGLIAADDIVAELSELCRDEHIGRSSITEITMFKSVGKALEDLAAAELLIDRLTP